MIGKTVSFYVYDNEGNEVERVGVVETTFYEPGDPRMACGVRCADGSYYTPDEQEVRIVA